MKASRRYVPVCYVYAIVLTPSQPEFWEIRFAKRREHLKLEDFPAFSKGVKPPRRIYGWIFDDSYMLALAARRRLSFKQHKRIRHLFGGDETFNFGDLTEEHFRNEELMDTLRTIALSKALIYFAGTTGTCLEVETVPSPRWQRVLVVWTNYNMGSTYTLYEEWREGGWKKMKKFLNDAMNECLPPGTEREELLWWWPMDYQ